MKDWHVGDCAKTLSFWDGRRAADAAFYATPKHNIWQMLSRAEALMACLDYMERKLGADLSRFKILDVGCATGYGLAPFQRFSLHSTFRRGFI